MAALGRGADAKERPDVVLIIAEDMQTSLGCYGNPIVQTPHLDALAARGMRFDNAQCQFPVCIPSRNSFLSGLRPETVAARADVDSFQGRLDYVLNGTTALPKCFRQHGYPTLADLCGMAIAERLEGTSILPLLREPNRSWKRCAFTVMGRGKSLRTERWRYTQWGGPDKAELYDHQKDPREIVNVANDPNYARTVSELSTLLSAGRKEAPPE